MSAASRAIARRARRNSFVLCSRSEDGTEFLRVRRGELQGSASYLEGATVFPSRAHAEQVQARIAPALQASDWYYGSTIRPYKP